MARPCKGNPTGTQKSPKFTPETIAKLKTAFSIDCTIEEACLYAKIDTATFYRWKPTQEKLFSEMESLRWTPILKARRKVVDGIGESFDNAMSYLKKKRKDEFSERSEQKVEQEVSVVDNEGLRAINTLLSSLGKSTK